MPKHSRRLGQDREAIKKLLAMSAIEDSIVADFTRKVEALEALLSTDPRNWARADELRRESAAVPDPIPGLTSEESVALSAALDALVTRLDALDLSPSYAAEHSKLAELEAAFAERGSFISSGRRTIAEQLALDMEAALRAEHAKAPSDERAAEKLAYLARRARDLVFAR